jgi:DNA repair protein RadC
MAACFEEASDAGDEDRLVSKAQPASKPHSEQIIIDITELVEGCAFGLFIFVHNHPSGVPEPSRADELLTQALKQSLVLADCKVLDHFVVAGTNAISFAERGSL